VISTGAINDEYLFSIDYVVVVVVDVEHGLQVIDEKSIQRGRGAKS